MKNLVFFFSLLTMFVLSSCSKDDTPGPGQEQATVSVVFSGINISEGYGSTTPIYTTQLQDVLSSANKDKAPYVQAASIQNSKSYISIQGQGAETLQKATINLMDGTDLVWSKVLYTYNLNLSSVESDGINDSTNPCIAFLSNIADYMAAKKSTNIQVILNAGTENVTNLKVTIHILAIFSW